MGQKPAKGLVIRVTGGEVWVDVGGEQVAALLRGRFRQKKRSLQVVAGDRVAIAEGTAGGPAVIEELLPRRSWLSRHAGGRHATERVIVANIDLMFLVVATREPAVVRGFADRVLVSAERGKVDTRIIVNKIDLVDDAEEYREFVELYESIGYPVATASAKTGAGLEELRKLLGKGVYAFVGQSGTGKSSLLNRIDPTLDLKVRKVGGKTGRGRHTTTNSQLFPFGDGYIADTPGMQTYGFAGTDGAELADCFPEFRKYAGDCRFTPCTHTHEPDCAVKEALEAGKIATTRHQSYEQMLEELEQREKEKY